MSDAHGEDTFFTATGEEDGKPLIFRGQLSVPDGVKEEDFPYLLSVSWSYAPANDGGMPDGPTNDRQIELEDALEHLEQGGSCHLMLVVTGNGRKEWHWYAKNSDQWIGELNSALSGISPFPIEIEVAYQADWSLYHNFMAGMNGT